MRRLVILIAFACAAFAQRHKIEVVDSEKPEGKLLQQIMQENDAAKRTPLLEQFASEYPKHNDIAWVLEQLQQSWVKAGDPDKILAAGDRLLAVDPDDPEAALQNLKAAEAKKDIALVKRYSAATAAAARKNSDAGYAKGMLAYSGFALYRAAAESRDPKLTIDLGETLRRQDPQGEYSAKVAVPLFAAYRQTNDQARALALAEQAIAAGEPGEDMLLVVADTYSQQKKEPQKVHEYAAKVVEMMSAKPKPEGMADADWASRKMLVTGLARYTDGKLYYNESNFGKADGELRAALPLVESNAAIKAEVLYLLGFANYKLDRAQDAANYYRACAAMKSPFQALAAKNLAGVKTQYTGIK